MHLNFRHVEFSVQPFHTKSATVKTYRLQKCVLDWGNLRYFPQVGFDMSDIKLCGLCG
jgi:hypothetical protein